MDAQQIAIAEQCQNAAHEGTMAFPDIVGTLTRAGFEGYIVDYRRRATTYYLPGGDSVVLAHRFSDGTVAANFSQSSNGDSLLPVVPSDHGWVNIYTRSPWSSSVSRSSDTAPLAV